MFSAIVKYTSDRVWQRRFAPISVTLVLIACMLLVRGQLSYPVQPVSLPSDPVPAQAEAPAYTAAVLGNQMAIYTKGRTAPLFVTSIDVRTLPQADREALEEGIALADEAAITRLLEDFGS